MVWHGVAWCDAQADKRVVIESEAHGAITAGDYILGRVRSNFAAAPPAAASEGAEAAAATEGATTTSLTAAAAER